MQPTVCWVHYGDLGDTQHNGQWRDHSMTLRSPMEQFQQFFKKFNKEFG
jgi:hypothetical protein